MYKCINIAKKIVDDDKRIFSFWRENSLILKLLLLILK